MLAAIISALANSGSLLVDKIILSKKKLTLKLFLPLSFIFLFAFTALLVPAWGRVDWQTAMLPSSLFMLVILILVAIAYNVLFYQGLQHDNVHHHEMLMMSTPIVTIFLAALFYRDDLDMRVLYLALVASIALIFARSNKEHYKPSKHSMNTMLAVVLMSLETIIVKELLWYYTPVALYAIRTGILAVFFAMYYRSNITTVATSTVRLVALSAFIGAAMMIGRFYAFSELGIVYTTLITVMAPIIVFMFSWEVLKEHIRFRVVLASLVILVCVSMATIITFQ